ncbi:4-amino-4-deoxychorismate lyase [Paenibacillus sophorae]|uniref:4-amino-4-deoxychorismate lyase n=1 Tax=Paenibacillus sophorae TaxID=1333845 RepID=A0A1H8V6Q9_9BACL|nr:aminotransferase class IV [Paenibacillus sophorae]QWU16361.1 aminotransferase class IV [Paenibacillus sophorae]SEP10943.1 4-amino-4-deoxychorismate lyase [Paenibacillus sophorae]
MNYIGVNGGVVDAGDAVVSVRDHGFLYGIGLFETFRTYGGRPFLLERHLKRMVEGCIQLGIPYKPDPVGLTEWIAELMKRNGLQEAYIRYTVTAGEDVLGLPAGDYTRPNQVLFAKALPPRPIELDTEGKELQLLKLRRNTPEGLVRFKSLHYMNNILAKRELSLHPSAARGAEGLMLTERGEVAEGIVSNVFFVQAGRLFTPDESTGLLPGITREMVMQLARSEGLKGQTGLYPWETLRGAEEIFLTNSIQEIVPVTILWEENERTVVGSGSAGPVTSMLLKKYRQRAGVEQ